MNIIEATGIKKGFPQPDGGTFWALRGIDLSVPEGKLTILRGRSGSGKTTMMNILGALDPPTEGKVIFDGQDITDWNDQQRTMLRRKNVGFIFQSVALISMMNAYENVEYALRLAGIRSGRRDRVEECLSLVGLTGRKNHMPSEMSGGEQQRVAIARAIAHKPKILFADEPTAELDTNTGLMVMKIFKDLVEQEKITVVMTTHDVGLMELGDIVYQIEAGELVNGTDGED